ncbi:MAG: cytochrome C oxidase subunit IV family protein [Gemmataceae bacterium]|nr:cytochrome C oxidase subunit IV family protein [Gemmataceae bacterium]
MEAQAPSHVQSSWAYLTIFAALVVLTGTTVGAALAPLGHWHIPVALLIAAGKAILIYLFFMHGLESGRLVWLIVMGALLCLSILLSFTLADYRSRPDDSHLRGLRSAACEQCRTTSG